MNEIDKRCSVSEPGGAEVVRFYINAWLRKKLLDQTEDKSGKTAHEWNDELENMVGYASLSASQDDHARLIKGWIYI